MLHELENKTALITGAAKRLGRDTALTLSDRGIYILSKHVLATMTRMMALEFAPHITVNAVAPGLVLPPPGKDESYLRSLVHTVPLQRHGGAQDIADAIAFLIESDFITGNVIYVDGGRHLHEYDNGSHPH